MNLLLLSSILYIVASGAEGYGYRRTYARSCQFWKNGIIYRGPCKGQSYGGQEAKFGQTGGSGQVGNFHKIRLPVKKTRFRSHHKPKPTFYPEGNEQCQTTDGLVGNCQPPATCYFQYDDIEVYKANQCVQGSGLKGICCPTKEIREPSSPGVGIRIPPKLKSSAQVPHLDEREIEKAAQHSRRVIEENLKLERQLVEKGFFQEKNTMEARHQSFFGGPTEIGRKLSRHGLIGLETSLRIAQKFRLSPGQARDGLTKYSLKHTSEKDTCIEVPKCYRSKYRTMDASCNNLEYPLWGKSNTAMNRLLPPAYADGLNELRVSVDGGELPSPREVSLAGAHDKDFPDRKFTLVVMQWGQFLDHDMTLASSTRLDSTEGEGLVCCREELEQNAKLMHPACKPIYINLKKDHFYARFGRTCLNFVRNAASPRPGCTLGPREQTNTLTHFMDGSMIYGSTDERANDLRLFRQGLLRFSIVNNVEFLPFDTQNKSDECAIPESRHLQCFVGGDVRVNEQTGLTIMHMLWLREHNRIAKILCKLNPHWNDELIYQETRRIVSAQVQHITYNEWQPLILGRRTMKEFNLMLKPSGFSYDYDDTVNPSILNSFATAAYRFHTLIQGLLHLMNNQGHIKQTLMLRNLFNNPQTLYEKGNFDRYLNALTGQPTQTFDQFFTEEITNHLFEEHGTGFGMDLISLNIQRGRDHGLPGYNHYRRICGIQPVTSFDELRHYMRSGSAEIMAKLYRHVDDIDLFIAINHEKAMPDGVVGPTMGCILAEQSRRAKLGDRFFYENGDLLHSFSLPQLDAIRKVSLAGVICANADAITDIQPLAFLQYHHGWNPRTPCEKIPQLDLILWQNEPID